MKQPKKFIQDIIDANYNADDEYIKEPVPRAMGGDTKPVTIKLTYDEESGQYKANYYPKDLVNMIIAGFEVDGVVYPGESDEAYISIQKTSTATMYNLFVSDYEQYTSDTRSEEDIWYRGGVV